MTDVADFEQREIAVTRFGRNLSVSAGAGSGKTSLLVERILFGVLARGLRLGRVVAITFTEKAAAELRQRLLLALEDCHRGLPSRTDPCGESVRTLERLDRQGIDPETVQVRLQRATSENPAVHTIHGYLVGLLNRSPTAAGVPPHLEVDEGTQFHSYVRKHFMPAVTAALQAGGELEQRLRRVLEATSLTDLRSLVERCADLPASVVLEEPSRLLDGLQAECKTLSDELAAINEALHLKRRAKIRDELECHLGAWNEFVAWAENGAADSLTDRLAAHDLLEFLGRPLPKIPASATGIEASSCLRLLAESRDRLRDLLRLQRELADDLLHCAGTLGRKFRDGFKRAGCITFDGLLSAGARLLREYPEIRRAEAARIEQLLIDEFQDTDSQQCEIAFLLTESRDTPPVQDPWSAVLEPGKLFLVGDAKQSIYRFRGADLGTYHRAVAKLVAQGGERISLSVSFRSPEALVRPLNELFAASFPARDEYESGYEELVSGCPDVAGAGIEIWSVAGDPGEGTEQLRKREGEVIAQQIQEQLEDGRAPRDVAVLLRTLSELHHYIDPLRARGIPCVVDGGRTFLARTEVDELLSVLLAVADPGDGIAFLGALRSSVFAVPDRAIARCARDLGEFTWPAARAAPGHELVRQAAERIAGWHGLSLEQPASVVLDAIIEDSMMLPLASMGRDGAQCIANLRKLGSIVQEKTSRLGVPFRSALGQIVELLERPEGESESSLADEGFDAVRILTIHKAKGLEFPLVIVPDLARGERTRPPRRPVIAVDRTQVALSVPGSPLCNLAWVCHAIQERRHVRAEARRLFYVAFTRARERLIAVHSEIAGAEEALGVRNLSAWGYPAEPGGHSLYPGISWRRFAAGEIPRSARPPTTSEDLDLVPAVQNFERMRRLFAKETRPLRRPAELGHSSQSGRTERRENRRPASRDPGLAAAVGTACHRILEAAGPGAQPSMELLRHHVKAVSWLSGVSSAELLREVEKIMNSTAAASLRRHFAGVTVIARELALTWAHDRYVYRGTADLVYRSGEQITVADYKTDVEAAGEILQNRHAGQLTVYAQALKRAMGLDRLPRLEVVLLRHGETRLLLPISLDAGLWTNASQ